MSEGTARQVGEVIYGETITYAFGSVKAHPDGLRTTVSLSLRGQAFVVRAWRRRTADDPAAPQSPFVKLVALSATAECGRHDADKKKSRLMGHGGRTGTLRVNSSVVVDIPMTSGGGATL